MKFLTDNTFKVFNEISCFEFLSHFTFVGGSAISYFLNHRLSEDLDFFSWHKELPVEINNFIKKVSEKSKVETSNLTKNYADLFINNIKITFFANDWDVLKTDRKEIQGNVYIADLPLLCAMKINTLSLRAKYRDYYDLYVINKEKYDINKIYNFANKYIPGMTKKIFGMQLTYIEDIEDESIAHLSPRYKTDLKKIQKHFNDELKQII